MRTGGGSINDFVNAIGAQAVGIGLPEVYTAHERGSVDCAITGTGTGNNVEMVRGDQGSLQSDHQLVDGGLFRQLGVVEQARSIPPQPDRIDDEGGGGPPVEVGGRC